MLGKNRDILKKTVKFLKEHLGENIFSVLLYGSALYSPNNVDLDILVILKRKKNPLEDLLVLKQLKNEIKKENFDLQLVYLEEISNPKLFSLDIHGSFFIEILKKAYPLIGKNPFLELEAEIADVQTSVVKRIQNYIFRERQEFIGIGRYTKDKNPSYHAKKIARILDDILIFDEEFKNHQSGLEKFLEKYPNFFTKQELKILKDKSPHKLEDYVPIYEKLYDLIISKGKAAFPSFLVKPLRGKEGKMVFEYLPSVNNNRRALIILDGIPSVPKKEELLNIFSNQGYFVFYPRYEGTWESEGEFLAKSPTEEINRLIIKILEGIKLNGVNFKAREVFLIGSSFGGAVALCLPEISMVKKVIVLSPVVDFTKLWSLKTLSCFLRNNFPGAYRYAEENWKKLEKGEILNPRESLKKVSDYKKYFILGGEDDEEVKSKELRKFAKEFNISVKIYPQKTHLSLSKIKGKILSDILEILK